MAKRINDFRFKQFEIRQQQSAMKVGTDGVLLGAWAEVASSQSVLDIGTGTGLIALMIAQRNKFSKIDAIEIDGGSYHEATYNVNNSAWKNRIDLHHISLQDYSSTIKKYDLIVSNPPFFSSGTKAPLKNRSQARHIDSLTFDDLLGSCNSLLSEHGIISLILPVKEGEKFIQKANDHKFYLKRQTTFYAKAEKKPERLLLEFAFKENQVIYDKLIHYNTDGKWSTDYIALTRDFYLNL